MNWKKQRDEKLLALLVDMRARLRKAKVWGSDSDLDYYLLDKIGSLNGTLNHQAIDALKRDPEPILTAVKRQIWKDRKRNRPPTIHVGDGNRPIRPHPGSDGQWDTETQVRVKIHLPSDPTPAEYKFTILPGGDFDSDRFEVNCLIEAFEELDNTGVLAIEKDTKFRLFLISTGGEHTDKIYKLILKYRPEKLTAAEISDKLDIPKRTVERRVSWIKKHRDLISHEMQSARKRMNLPMPGPRVDPWKLVTSGTHQPVQA